VGQWKWPDELDALLAASDHHQLLLENEHVRVLETVIRAGEATAVHTHRWPNVQYVVSGADFVRRDGDGKVTLDTRAGSGPPTPSTASWSGPIPPHSLENVGDAELCVIMVELKAGAAVETA
jgi:quercetin dioxygenase-like cupin family protein